MELVTAVITMCGSAILVTMFIMSLAANLFSFIRRQLGWSDAD